MLSRANAQFQEHVNALEEELGGWEHKFHRTEEVLRRQEAQVQELGRKLNHSFEANKTESDQAAAASAKLQHEVQKLETALQDRTNEVKDLTCRLEQSQSKSNKIGNQQVNQQVTPQRVRTSLSVSHVSHGQDTARTSRGQPLRDITMEVAHRANTAKKRYNFQDTDKQDKENMMMNTVVTDINGIKQTIDVDNFLKSPAAKGVLSQGQGIFKPSPSPLRPLGEQQAEWNLNVGDVKDKLARVLLCLSLERTIERTNDARARARVCVCG